MRRRLHRAGVGIVLMAALLPTAVPAQVAGLPVRAGSGPLSDLSDSVSAGSRPVHEPGSSLRDLSHDSLSDGPVSGTVTGTVRSGSVSDGSSGAVHDQNIGARFVPFHNYGNDGPDYAAEVAPDLSALQDSVSGIEPLPAEEDDEAQDADTASQADATPVAEVDDATVAPPDEAVEPEPAH